MQGSYEVDVVHEIAGGMNQDLLWQGGAKWRSGKGRKSACGYIYRITRDGTRIVVTNVVGDVGKSSRRGLYGQRDGTGKARACLSGGDRGCSDGQSQSHAGVHVNCCRGGC